MKCPKCNGKGKFIGYYVNDNPVECECVICNGTGEVQMTNEEYLRSCNTEQLAEALTKVVLDLISWNNDPKPSEVRNVLKSWLKQPHTIKEIHE